MEATTEGLWEESEAIDLLPPLAAAEALVQAQCLAAQAVSGSARSLLRAAETVAETLAGGGRLFYCGAGSSGLMAMADALELPGTYGIEPGRIVIILAGGQASLTHLTGGAEDDFDAGVADLKRAGAQKGDCVLVLSASGRTPYAMGIGGAAGSLGAKLVSIANNAGAPLLSIATVPVLLPTPPEPVAGSTRLGAGSAQKIALNTISTLAGILLGHVHDGMMVNLHADNAKLNDRAVRMVRRIATVDRATAASALAAADGNVKLAALLASGASDREQASQLLHDTQGRLRPALMALRASPQPIPTDNSNNRQL